jgi:heme/copper-type cytochrome/quinol oxidase subunit 1
MRLSEQHTYDNKNQQLPFGQYYSVYISVTINSLWKSGVNLWHMDSRNKVDNHNIKAITKGCQSGMILFAFPLLIAGDFLLELERSFDWPFFDPERGGTQRKNLMHHSVDRLNSGDISTLNPTSDN